MPYIKEDKISTEPFSGGIEITESEYQQALEAKLNGQEVKVQSGVLKILSSEKKSIWSTSDKSKKQISVDADIPDGYSDIEPGKFDEWTDGQWVINSEAHKKSLKVQYWREYLDYLDLGFEFRGVLYQCSPDDIDDWEKLKIYIEALPGETVTQLRGADNSMNDITIADFLAFFVPALGQHVMAARRIYWARVDAVV